MRHSLSKVKTIKTQSENLAKSSVVQYCFFMQMGMCSYLRASAVCSLTVSVCFQSRRAKLNGHVVGTVIHSLVLVGSVVWDMGL